MKFHNVQFIIKDMKKLIYTLLFFGLTAFAWHKYYVSVTEVYIKPQKLEIIIRTFPDDIENVLKDNYHINADLSQKQTKLFLEDYLRSHFIIETDKGEIRDYQLVGTTMEDEFLVILLQANLPKDIHLIKIKNTLLQDMFDEQKNIVHFFYKNEKQSFILVKQDPEATFRFD